MADLLSSVGPIALPATLLSPGAPSGTPNLAAFVDLMAGQVAAAPAAAVVVSGVARQDDAVPGNLLPDGDDDDGADPALAWILAGQMPVAPAVTPDTDARPVAVVAATASGVIASPIDGATEIGAVSPPISALPVPIGDAASPVPLPTFREGRGVGAERSKALLADHGRAPASNEERDPSARAPAPSPYLKSGREMPLLTAAPMSIPADSAAMTKALPAGAPATRAISLPATAPVESNTTTSAPDNLPVRRAPPTDRAASESRQTVPDAPVATVRPIHVPHPALSSAPTPASVVLPAIFALAAVRDRATDRDDRAAAPLSLDPAAAATTLAPAVAPAVAPAADAQRPMLDMGRQDWPQKMIEHIETLRDHADANDTSIRLKPEALGRVDIALRRHDDGAVSVRFTAEQPATRTLIADAAPQLREAAEARGIRMSQASVDLSHEGGEQRARPGVEPRRPIINIAAPGGEDIGAVDDGRIA